MDEISNISLFDLALGMGILIIPLVIFWYYHAGLIQDMLISLARMIIQLSLVATYLEWIFEKNDMWINMLWVFVMVVVSAGTVVYRIRVKWKVFIFPLILSGLVSMVIIDAFFIGLVIKPDYFFDARYFIPISGMILGNSLQNNIIGLTQFFGGLNDKKEMYFFILTNGNHPQRAIRPFIKDALIKGLNPLLANMSVIGLISLPGMMTGQILGGSSPATAIKYQIMIMIAILAGCTLTLILSIFITRPIVFDKMGSLKDIFRKA